MQELLIDFFNWNKFAAAFPWLLVEFRLTAFKNYIILDLKKFHEQKFISFAGLSISKQNTDQKNRRKSFPNGCHLLCNISTNWMTMAVKTKYFVSFWLVPRFQKMRKSMLRLCWIISSKSKKLHKIIFNFMSFM